MKNIKISLFLNNLIVFLVIMTSNNTSELSEALLRPSRVDMHFEVSNPDKDIRKEYFIKKGGKYYSN